MNYSSDKSQTNQEEQQPVSTSLQLVLIAAILTTIADGIATISAIAAIDEAKNDAQKEKQDHADSDERFDRMQKQIDNLTKELSEVKYSRFLR